MFDAGMLRAILHEINEYIGDGARVEKVYQPVRDEIDLLIHSAKAKSSRRLCINAGSNSPRISLSDIAKENPPSAPMFCMLLRKHLAGARLVRAEQLGFERAARLCFDCYDEMGYETFVIPDNIGGRFSVLTAVGLLPIAAAGIDIDKLMKGAKQAQDKYSDPDLQYNECYK